MLKNDELCSITLTMSLIKAIKAIRLRTLLTLSNITVSTVIDRTLLECTERHPVLADITNSSEGLNFEKFEKRLHDSKLEERQIALREFLIDLLDVFGRITANILTKYLIQELMTVTHESSANLPMTQTIPKLSAIKNRDKK